MKRLTVLAVLVMMMTTGFAQYQNNSFFTKLGVMRLTTNELLDDSIVTVDHRVDDVVWARTVYRIIDMRYRQNMRLYFPISPDDPQKYQSLFKVMIDAIADGMPIWEKAQDVGDIRPDFEKPAMERQMVPTILNTDREGINGDGNIATSEYMLLNYDSISGVMTKNDYSYTGFVKNQYKWMIQEVVFFDKHYSRMYRKIMAIAPMHADNVVYYDDMPVTEALYGQILFWIPFDSFRPFLTQKYIMPSRNMTNRLTYDQFFSEQLYSAYLVGEQDMYNRMITDYAKDPALVRKEQARIEAELLNFEQDLWEY